MIDINASLSNVGGRFSLSLYDVLIASIVPCWNDVLSFSAANTACTSSSVNGILVILPFSTLYYANEFDSTIIFLTSISLTTIAEFSSDLAFSIIVLNKPLSITPSVANFIIILNGILSSSG